jgi:hypothetical protein
MELARGWRRSPWRAELARPPAHDALWEEGGADDWSLLLEVKCGDEDEEEDAYMWDPLNSKLYDKCGLLTDIHYMSHSSNLKKGVGVTPTQPLQSNMRRVGVSKTISSGPLS